MGLPMRPVVLQSSYRGYSDTDSRLCASYSGYRAIHDCTVDFVSMKSNEDAFSAQVVCLTLCLRRAHSVQAALAYVALWGGLSVDSSPSTGGVTSCFGEGSMLIEGTGFLRCRMPQSV